MSVRRPPERLAVDGPAGKIEVVIDHPSVFPSEGADEPARGIGLVAHPHPLFGGTLDNKVAQTLVEYNQTVIQIAGHTDSTGSHAYNMKLSEQRASSVKTYLAGRGIAANRMVTIGAGPDYPIADNATAEGRAENRRVEITIVPVTEENLQKAKKG